MRSDSQTFLRGTTLSFLLYPLALIVAFFTSMLTYAIMLNDGVSLSFAHLSTGFVGVLLGSFCLPPASRLFGSIFLLVIGVGFFYVRFVWFNYEPELSDPWQRLVMLFFGGLLAVMIQLIWWAYKTMRRSSQ